MNELIDLKERQKQERLQIESQFENYLIDYHGLKGRILHCPSPEHEDRNASCIYNRNSNLCYCFACANGTDKRKGLFSVYDVIAFDYGLDRNDFKTVVEKAKQVFGIDEGGNAIVTHTFAEPVKADITPAKTSQKTPNGPNLIKAIEVMNERLLNDLEGITAFSNRGITAETIKKFKIGECNSAVEVADICECSGDPFKVKDFEKCKFVFPVWSESPKKCQVNSILFELVPRKEKEKYRKNKISPFPYLNEYYFSENEVDTVIVCEGYYDAISVEQCGLHACGLIGVAGKRLIELAKDFKGLIVLSLDNDDTGQKSNDDLYEELRKAGVRVAKLAPKYKDYNEQLQKDGQTEMTKWLSENVEKLKEKTKTELEEYYDTYDAKKISNFFQYVAERERIPSPFQKLNEVMNGGFTNEMYIFGGVSGIGKTTFALQMAVEMSFSQDVLYFSLEMQREQLQARILSMLSFKHCRFNRSTDEFPCTAVQMADLTSYQYPNRARNKAFEEFQKMKLKIIDSSELDDGSVNKILEKIDRHINLTGVKPVVFVDYLQFVKIPNNQAGKDGIEYNLRCLKSHLTEKKYSLILLSSLNRQSYTQQSSLSMFKESGLIEYTADFAGGLEFTELSTNEFKNVNEIIESNNNKGLFQPAKVTFRTLKNRCGKRAKIEFNMFGAFSYFEECNEVRQKDADSVDDEDGTDDTKDEFEELLDILEKERKENENEN